MAHFTAVWTALGEAGRSVILTLTMIAIAASAVNLHGKWKANTWMACLETGCGPIGAEEATAPRVVPITNVVAPFDGAALTDRLNNQLDDVRRRAGYHLKVTRDFYVNYYYSVTMALFLGAAAAILLFFISQSGWAAAKPWAIAAFIVTTTAAASFGAFPILYSQQDNIEQNKELYLQYRALEAEILSYGVTLEPLDRTELGVSDGQAVHAAAFIRHVDVRMAKLHKLPLGFDYKGLPADYLAVLPKEVKPTPPTPQTQPRGGETAKQPSVARTAPSGAP